MYGLFRMGVLQTSISLGAIIGLLISPLVYTKSYTYAFGLTTIFTIVGLIYASTFLKETVVIKKVFIKIFQLSKELVIFFYMFIRPRV